jgi:hypothetical protein
MKLKPTLRSTFLRITAQEEKLALSIAKSVAQPGQKLSVQDAFRIALANFGAQLQKSKTHR